MMFFFFIFGVIIGNIRSKTAGITAIIFLWLIFLFLIPGAFNAFINESAENITSNYKTELEKLNIMSGFERKVSERLGKFSKAKVSDFRQMAEEYWSTDFKKMEEIEENHKQEIIENIERYDRLSAFSPTTFYYLTCGEISSRGYGNFIEFYTYLQDLKHKFVRFWVDRVYYHDANIMVNFVKGDENLFHATSQLPGNFGTGVMINLAYILILITISFFNFKTYLYRLEVKRTVKDKNLPIILSKGDLVAMILYRDNHGYSDHLYNILSGHTNAFNKDLKIEVDSVDLTGNQTKQNFLYLCHPDKLPQNIKAVDFAAFLLTFLKPGKKERVKIFKSLKVEPFKSKTLGQLECDDKGRVFLSLLPLLKCKIFLLDDIAFDMPVDYIFELNDVMKDWSASGSAVIYLTTESEVNVKRYKAGLDRDVDKLEGWSSMVSELKKLTK
jgi:ABC-type transport system involved in cytochrome c biogenesis ATPase subunit